MQDWFGHRHLFILHIFMGIASVHVNTEEFMFYILPKPVYEMNKQPPVDFHDNTPACEISVFFIGVGGANRIKIGYAISVQTTGLSIIIWRRNNNRFTFPSTLSQYIKDIDAMLSWRLCGESISIENKFVSKFERWNVIGQCLLNCDAVTLGFAGSNSSRVHPPQLIATDSTAR